MAEKRVKPSRGTARKIHLRASKKHLLIVAKTVEEALQIPATKLRRNPKVQVAFSSNVTALSSNVKIVAIPPGHAERIKLASDAKPAIKIANSLKPVPPIAFATPPTSKGLKLKSKPKNSRAVQPKIAEPKERGAGKHRKILPYDGQSRFEAGIRIVQGGLPELGRRR